MRFVKPEVFLIGKTQINNTEVERWLRFLGCDEATVKKYAEGQNKTAAERLVELEGRRCYLAFVPGINPNVTKIREDIADYCTNILKQKHGSVLEHYVFNFVIENVSRVFTGELNRHRAGVAISEGSMRYIRYNDIPLVETPLLTITDEDKADEDYKAYMNTPYFDEDMREFRSIAAKKQKTRELFARVTRAIEDGYSSFQEIWAEELRPESKFSDKKHVTSLGRRIIPMGVATGGGWSLNLRALRHVVTMRASEAAEEEIALVAGKILEIMMREEPVLFGDFFKNESGYWTPVYEKV